MAGHLASEMMRTPELALETHAREELGINPNALGSPVQAAVSSFATFALGAVVPLVPWLVTRGTAAVVASVAAAAVAALAVGFALAAFTRRPGGGQPCASSCISAVAAAVTFGIGSAVGVSPGH